MFRSRKLSEKVILIMIVFFVFLGIYFSRTDLQYFEGVYVVEDGFIEWMTVLALFLGGSICFYRVVILKPFRKWPFILGLILFGLLFYFGVGEEISWGQRIFDFETPEIIKQYNTQGEFNIHNLKFSGKKVNKIFFGVFLGICILFYFLVFPVLYKKFDRIKKASDSMAFPVPKMTYIGVYFFLVLSCELVMGGKKGELLEFAGCWIFVMMVWEPANREIFSRKSFER